MLQDFRKGIKGGVNSTRSTDDMVFLVLNTQADFVVDRLEGSSVPRAQSQYMLVFTIKICTTGGEVPAHKPVMVELGGVGTWGNSLGRLYSRCFGGRSFLESVSRSIVTGGY